MVDDKRWIAGIAATAVLSVGLIVLGWRIHGLGRRVAELEGGIEEGSATQARSAAGGVRPSGRRSSAGDLESLPGAAEDRRGSFINSGSEERSRTVDASEVAEALELDADDPETLELIEDIVSEVYEDQEAQRSERREEYIVSRVQEEVEEFAEEHDLDGQTTQALVTLLSDASTQRMALREAAMNGDMTWDEVRTARETLTTETNEQIEELIGADQASDLAEQLPWFAGRR